MQIQVATPSPKAEIDLQETNAQYRLFQTAASASEASGSDLDSDESFFRPRMLQEKPTVWKSDSSDDEIARRKAAQAAQKVKGSARSKVVSHFVFLTVGGSVICCSCCWLVVVPDSVCRWNRCACDSLTPPPSWHFRSLARARCNARP